jgi:hypothetical protein
VFSAWSAQTEEIRCIIQAGEARQQAIIGQLQGFAAQADSILTPTQDRTISEHLPDGDDESQLLREKSSDAHQIPANSLSATICAESPADELILPARSSPPPHDIGSDHDESGRVPNNAPCSTMGHEPSAASQSTTPDTPLTIDSPIPHREHVDVATSAPDTSKDSSQREAPAQMATDERVLPDEDHSMVRKPRSAPSTAFARPRNSLPRKASEQTRYGLQPNRSL